VLIVKGSLAQGKHRPGSRNNRSKRLTRRPFIVEASHASNGQLRPMLGQVKRAPENGGSDTRIQLSFSRI